MGRSWNKDMDDSMEGGGRKRQIEYVSVYVSEYVSEYVSVCCTVPAPIQFNNST